jgi:hypothetical protein
MLCGHCTWCKGGSKSCFKHTQELQFPNCYAPILGMFPNIVASLTRGSTSVIRPLESGVLTIKTEWTWWLLTPYAYISWSVKFDFRIWPILTSCWWFPNILLARFQAESHVVRTCLHGVIHWFELLEDFKFAWNWNKFHEISRNLIICVGSVQSLWWKLSWVAPLHWRSIRRS